MNGRYPSSPWLSPLPRPACSASLFTAWQRPDRAVAAGGHAGEWLAYTVNVVSTGTYTAGFRVASSHSGSSIKVYVDDGTTPVATVNVPNTGNWPTFQTVSVPVTLPAGQHRLKFSFPTDYVNINWVTFA